MSEDFDMDHARDIAELERQGLHPFGAVYDREKRRYVVTNANNLVGKARIDNHWIRTSVGPLQVYA